METNSHYLVSKKFILPYMCVQDQRFYKGETRIQVGYGGNWEYIEDLAKALCYVSGDNYETFGSLSSWVRHRFKVITDKEVIFKEHIENYDGVAEKTDDLNSKGVAYKVVDHYRPTVNGLNGHVSGKSVQKRFDALRIQRS